MSSIPIRRGRLLGLALPLLIACEGKGTAVQSERDALVRICAADVEAKREGQGVSEWVRSNVTNPRVGKLYEGIEAGDMNEAAALRDAARKESIRPCALVEPTWSSVDVPRITGVGAELPGSQLPLVVVSPTQIGVGLKPVMSVDRWRVDSHDAKRFAIAPITEAMRALPLHPTHAIVAFDRTTPYGLAIGVLAAIKSAGVRELQIAARKGDVDVLVPVELPSRIRSSETDVRLVVELTPTELRVWSISGTEGSPDQPAFVGKRSSEGHVALSAALQKIVARRFARSRSEEDRAITLIPTNDATVEEVVETISYVRRSGAANLFDEVRLAAELRTRLLGVE